MPKIISKIDRTSEEFKANHQANTAIVEEFRSKVSKAKECGGEKSIERHRSRGKMLPRERIDMILDESKLNFIMKDGMVYKNTVVDEEHPHFRPVKAPNTRGQYPI